MSNFRSFFYLYFGPKEYKNWICKKTKKSVPILKVEVQFQMCPRDIFFDRNQMRYHRISIADFGSTNFINTQVNIMKFNVIGQANLAGIFSSEFGVPTTSGINFLLGICLIGIVGALNLFLRVTYLFVSNKIQIFKNRVKCNRNGKKERQNRQNSLLLQQTNCGARL
ncbi:hypothetical protein BpHYR1_038576 [Brachionus plicatilis]|uniref:Uncharacterized protein n=1 Tax=Brachionus plicatilis TaxID=10195 RepID=A0A3M7T9A5_BRAPC|nr:hypothetical protein BpHYR1_038576 [Brachionus plicatilis]